MDALYILAQLFAFIACGLNVISMWCKKKKINIIFLNIRKYCWCYRLFFIKSRCGSINSNNLNYDNNINILPSYLSKGLEFDSVILVNKCNFKKNSVLDMKLLYVTMTRALHKLIIVNGK